MGTDPRRIGTVLITWSCNIWNTRMNHAVRGCMRAAYYGQPFPNTLSTTKFAIRNQVRNSGIDMVLRPERTSSIREEDSQHKLQQLENNTEHIV